jgi:predicted CopG family antitoxin
MNMEDITRVPVERSTREALKALKRGGESYDAVIRRLMKEAKG